MVSFRLLIVAAVLVLLEFVKIPMLYGMQKQNVRFQQAHKLAIESMVWRDGRVAEGAGLLIQSVLVSGLSHLK